MPTPRRLAAVAFVALLSATSSASAATPQKSAAATSTSATTAAPAVRTLVATVLDDYAGNNNKPTQRYYANGVWYNSDNTQNWASTQGGAALAAASLWSSTGRTNSALRSKAIDTITTAISAGQNADGSFSTPPAAAVGPGGAGVTTEFFARMFGDTYLLVQSTLTAAQRRAWVSSLTRAADFLITNKDVTWYANGNVNLGYAQTLYLAWRASGQARFATAYDAEWSFLLSPDQVRWPGFGLRLTRTPTRADGANGAGYLAEKGFGPAPGFDAEYAMVQLSEASDLYTASRDPRALRLANLLMNVLRPRISSTMMLDTSGGTRHTELVRSVPFTSSASAILYWLGGRDDLSAMVPDYLSAVTTAFTVSLPWPSNPGYYGSLGVDVAAMVRVNAPGYVLAPPTSPSSTTSAEVAVAPTARSTAPTSPSSTTSAGVAVAPTARSTAPSTSPASQADDREPSQAARAGVKPKSKHASTRKRSRGARSTAKSRSKQASTHKGTRGRTRR